MSVSGYWCWRVEPRHQYAVSLSKTLYPLASVDSAVKWAPGGDNLVKGVQCYELIGGIALENHAFYKINNNYENSNNYNNNNDNHNDYIDGNDNSDTNN